MGTFCTTLQLGHILIFSQIPKLQRLIALSVVKVNRQWRTFFFFASKFIQISHFFLIFLNFLLHFFQHGQIKNFLRKQKLLKAHRSFNSENKPSMKRNFSLSHPNLSKYYLISPIFGYFLFHSSVWQHFNFFCINQNCKDS